jgi:hypothetical protein
MRNRHTFDFPLAAAAAVFFTSSFDIFLTVNVGATLRIAQIFMLFLLFATLLKCRMGLSINIPLGGLFLSAWLWLQLSFVPASFFWQKSLAYCAWLALDISISFSLVNLFALQDVRTHRLLDWYAASYVLVAGFGVVQFILPIIGGPGLLVQDWWLPGRIARASGFSYEPSYYATYLIIGLACIGSLRRSNLLDYRSRVWTLSYLLIILAILVSSSRIGIAFLLLEISIAPLKKVWHTVLDPLRVLDLRFTIRRCLAGGAILCVSWLAISGAIQWTRRNMSVLELLASGTGLLGSAAHSVQNREDAFQNTLHVIADHPLVGRSLGGITESIASYSGQVPRTIEAGKEFEGQCVFAEVLAASGIPGSILFFSFVAITIVMPLRMARRSTPFYAAWLRALVVSLIFEWGILQFNQNILRVYLWVHIAILAAVYAAAQSEQLRQFQLSGTSRLSQRGAQ